MEQPLVHLKTKLSFQNVGHQEKSREILSAFKNACLQLDASLFEPYMSENDCFEDLDKYRFLNSLKDTFERIRQRASEEIEVTMHNTTCRGCSYGKPVMSFNCTGKKSRLYGSFGYLIDMENGVLKDIYQCNAIKMAGDGFDDNTIEALLAKYR